MTLVACIISKIHCFMCNRRIESVARAASIFAAGLAIAAAMQSELPAGPGQEQVEKVCSGCHTFTVFTQNRATKEKWGEIVDNMVSRGAEGTDAEIDQVVNYLAAHFGADVPRSKVNVNKASAAELVKGLAITTEHAGIIVEYRTKNGNFKDLKQLESVQGIDRKIIEDRKDWILF